MRLASEYENSYNAYFVTLTYNDEKATANAQKLNVIDVQLFLKRLRKELSKVDVYHYPSIDRGSNIAQNAKFRYFIVGEYGDRTNRPHYHGVLFDIPYKIGLNLRDEFAKNKYIRELIEKNWSNGLIHVGSITVASLKYILKYVLKSDTEKNKETIMICSKRPYLGKSYEKKIQFNKDNLTSTARVLNQKFTLPRIYKDKYFNAREKEKMSEKTRDFIAEAHEKSYKEQRKHAENELIYIQEYIRQEQNKLNLKRQKL